ncbi:MAG: tripartite tricarboxylate transporter substrate binding protein [Betaproteobacteria bacterium]
MTRPLIESSGPAARPRRRTVLLASAAFMALGPAVQGSARAQAQRTIRLVSGSAPGSSTDLFGRLIGPKLAERRGATVIVDNKLGAGGLIAAESVATARPDGSSLLITASNHSIGAALRKSSPFDAIRDFSWISSLTTYGMVLAVGPNSRHKSLPELLAFAKANPQAVSFSSVGVGTAHHLLGEWINAELGIELTHVPYKGSPLALTDLLGGQIDMMIDTATFVVPQSRQGKLKPLAVSTRNPSEDLPGVPTLSSFIAGMEYDSWIGITGPKGMSAELVQQLNQDLREIASLPDIRQRFIEMGAAPKVGTPEEFRRLAERDLVQWRKVIDSRNIARL